MLCPRAAVRTFIVGAAGIAAAVLAYLQRLPGVAGVAPEAYVGLNVCANQVAWLPGLSTSKVTPLRRP
jgi:hypothetical protein